MSSLRATGLAFAYSDAAPLFQDVSFQLSPGFTGLVGPNGAGKTTLLRVISGELSPREGSVRHEGTCVLCPQRVETLTDEVKQFAQSHDSAARRLHGQLKLDPSELERWETLSPGERKRWQLGAALASEPEVLLLDEPTNHLDASGRALMLGALKRFRGVGLVVSHDRTLLNALTHATLRLEREGAEVWPLPYDEARAQWERERQARVDAHQERRDAQKKASKQLAQAREAMRAATHARSTRVRMRNKHDSDARSLGAATLAEWSQERIGRNVAHARKVEERAEEALAESDLRKELGRSVFLRYEPAPKPMLAWLDTSEVHAGDCEVLRDVRVSVSRDSRVWISGDNGAGKSTLIHRLLADAALPEERVLYLPQDLAAGSELELLEELRALDAEERGRALSLVAALGVDVDRLLASHAPSPGEARKLALALGLARHVWLLVLDEPTNHLDLPSIERLQDALSAYPGALLLVSHDESLARACTSERWIVRSGRVERADA